MEKKRRESESYGSNTLFFACLGAEHENGRHDVRPPQEPLLLCLPVKARLAIRRRTVMLGTLIESGGNWQKRKRTTKEKKDDDGDDRICGVKWARILSTEEDHWTMTASQEE